MNATILKEEIGMKINKEDISQEDKELAVQVINSLRNGNRVIGTPARGLQITLKQLESKRDSVNVTKLDWLLKDRDLEESIAKLKAGIEGETQLGEFLSQLLKYNDSLDGIIAFASLSQEQDNNDKDYIPDSDFLIVHKDKFLIIDAKNISTNPNVPIHFVGNDIVTDSDKPKPILPGIHSSQRVWEEFFTKHNIKWYSIRNLVCIVNKTGAYITPPEESSMEVIHISTLNKYLTDWYNLPSGVDYVKLNDLTQLAKCQIRQDKSDLDLSYMKKVFKI